MIINTNDTFGLREDTMQEIKRYRNTWAEIDLNAIEYNVNQLRGYLPAGSKIMGVVKADSYGHGSVQVARKLVSIGIDYLMVALLEEALLLRKHGISVPILVVGRVQPADVPIAVNQNITLTVHDIDWLRAIRNLNLNSPVYTHIELDTGMGRTGIYTKESLNALIDEYNENKHARLEGVFTHFSTADEIDSSYFDKQMTYFEELLSEIAERYNGSLIVHNGNSAAGIQYPEKMQQYTRCGVTLYGLYPSVDIYQLRAVELEPVFALYSELIQVKKLKPDDCISYGATYCAKEEEWIGTIPMGYADGWRRDLQDFYVLINGKRMPIVGRICMDAFMVKLDQSYKVGTKVTLIGKSGDDTITLDDIAQYVDTINYEIPCMITGRVPREYIEK